MILAIDYDGTIADSNAVKRKWIRTHLHRDIPVWLCNKTDCVPLIGEAVYQKMGDRVYERESTLRAPAVPGAIAALQALAKTSELHVVTARRPRRLAFAEEWLTEQGIMHLFTGVHSSHGTVKSTICRRIGARLLVDDDTRHLGNTDYPGLGRILMQCGRDDTPEVPDGVVFLRDWPSVVSSIKGMD